MNCFSYRMELIKLHHRRSKEEKAFYRKLEKAEQTANSELISEVRQVESFPLQELDEEISTLMTQRLKYIADKLLIPLPPKPMPEEGDVIIENEIWRRSNYSGEWYLKTKGTMDVRKLIRQDRKERLELVTPWFALMIGIIGAVTGLIAIMRK